MYANYRKVGETWGVVCHGDVATGDVVEVTLRDGRVKTEKLGDVIGQWEFNDGRRLNIYATVKQERAVADVGNLAGVMALFDRAKGHLKFPAIVLGVPGANDTIRINVAGAQAKVPGSLNVVSKNHIDANGRKVWYGRVLQSGAFEQARSTPVAVVEKLQAFAADPANVAAEHGRLTGKCCFCNLPLKDERSTAVGYGGTCAKHYGMPWGVAKTDLRAAA